jgi:hypothetical protein
MWLFSGLELCHKWDALFFVLVCRTPSPSPQDLPESLHNRKPQGGCGTMVLQPERPVRETSKGNSGLGIGHGRGKANRYLTSNGNVAAVYQLQYPYGSFTTGGNGQLDFVLHSKRRREALTNLKSRRSASYLATSSS